jgi:hypothetical protein
MMSTTESSPELPSPVDPSAQGDGKGLSEGLLRKFERMFPSSPPVSSGESPQQLQTVSRSGDKSNPQHQRLRPLSIGEEELSTFNINFSSEAGYTPPGGPRIRRGKVTQNHGEDLKEGKVAAARHNMKRLAVTPRKTPAKRPRSYATHKKSRLSDSDSEELVRTHSLSRVTGKGRPKSKSGSRGHLGDSSGASLASPLSVPYISAQNLSPAAAANDSTLSIQDLLEETHLEPDWPSASSSVSICQPSSLLQSTTYFPG